MAKKPVADSTPVPDRPDPADVSQESPPSRRAARTKRGDGPEHRGRLAAEEALAAERSRLRTVLDTLPDLVWLKDPDGRFLACNHAFERLMGAPEAELVGRTDADYVDRELAEQFRYHDREAMKSSVPLVNEEWVVFAEGGARVLLETKKTAVRDPSGRVLGVVGVARDVTATRATADALQRSEERLRRLIEHAPIAIAMFDREMRYVVSSRRWRIAFHLEDVPLEGRLHYDVDPTIPERYREAHRRGLAGQITRSDEDRLERPDGSVQWLRWEVLPWRDAFGAVAGIVILADDISERKRSQEAVERYYSGSPSIVYALRVESDGLHAAWLGGDIRRFTGWSEQEVLVPGWWLSNLHPDDRARVAAASSVPYEIDHQTLEFRFRRKGGDYIWIRDEKRLLRDPEGRPTEIVGSWTDVTSRVELEERLRTSQKLEAIGRLAGGVAHDFNNLLTVISGNSELIGDPSCSDEERRELVSEIRAAADRAAVLTRQLLAFGRTQTLAPQLVRLDAAVRRLAPMLSSLLGEHAKLRLELSSPEDEVRVDPGQLELVVLNLTANAVDAMPQGGTLTISTEPVEIVRQSTDEPTAIESGSYLRLRIRDTGRGMSPSVKQRVFEPFFTTKPHGAATGLGLSTVFGIVKQSGGHIDVQSEEGVGTEFTIHLPTVAPVEAPSGRAGHEPAERRGGETVLLVEDEAAVRRLARTALESRGYRILAAQSGEEALVLAERHGDAIDLLLSDLVMPGMSGRELAERLRAARPGLAVLLMSGYPQDTLRDHGIDERDMAFLHKPFALAALADKVRAVIDRNAQRTGPPPSSASS